MEPARGDTAVAFSRALHSPGFRLCVVCGFAVPLAWFLASDWQARAAGLPSDLAPTAADLWLATGIGAAVGAVVAVWERFLLTRRRADQLAFHRAPMPARLGWRIQRVNLRQNGWVMALLVALLGWCAWWRVAPLTPALAGGVVCFASNRRLAAEFQAELGGRVPTDTDLLTGALYVLRDPTGLWLCTAEPAGGCLAVFTGPSAAARFIEARDLRNWTPTPITHEELLGTLRGEESLGRVRYVMLNPLSGDGRAAPMLPLAECIASLSR